jgi:hypothetical protein
MNLQKNERSDVEMPLFGDQMPRILSSPQAPTSAGEEAIELAAEEFGLFLDPWQQLVLLETLKERPDGKWAAFEVGLMVSRQNGKGSCLTAVELAGIFLFGEELILHTAHELKTSKEAMRRLEFYLKKSGVKYKTTHSHGEERIEIIGGPQAGARVMFQTRTKVAGLGLSIDRVIFDEAMIIPSEAVQVLMPTLSARSNATPGGPQIWYTGSAVDQRMHANCEVFAGIRNRGLSGTDPRLCYIEWSCPEDVDPKAPKMWAQANPGLGYRVTTEIIEDEYRSFDGMGDIRAFGVQRLGIGDWPLLGDARSAIPVEKWRTMANTPRLVGRPAVALTRAPEGGPWTIAAAQRTDDGRVHLEIGYSGTDTADLVISRLVDVTTAWDPVAVIVASGASAEVLPELEIAGIEAIVPTRGDEAVACGGLLNDAQADTAPPLLSHGNQKGLNHAATRAIKHELPSGGFIWEVIEGSSWSQLTGATLARWGLLKFGGKNAEPTIHEWPSDAEMKSWLEEDDDLYSDL